MLIAILHRLNRSQMARPAKRPIWLSRLWRLGGNADSFLGLQPACDARNSGRRWFTTQTVDVENGVSDMLYRDGSRAEIQFPHFQ